MYRRSFAFETSRQAFVPPARCTGTRAARRTAKAFDRHGAALYTFASALAQDAAEAQMLVVQAIETQDGYRTFRELAGAVYLIWSYRPPTAGAAQDPEWTTSEERLLDEHRAVLALCTVGGHTRRQAGEVLGLPHAEVSHLVREAALSRPRRGMFAR